MILDFGMFIKRLSMNIGEGRFREFGGQLFMSAFLGRNSV
jgi:hypothetical protein